MKKNKNPPLAIQLEFRFLEEEEIGLSAEELRELDLYELKILNELNL